MNKTEQKIEKMTIGGKMLAEVLFEVLGAVKPGVTELELDGLAERLILEKGGYPGFKKVKGYKHTVCMSTNNVVVHGIPSLYVLKEGDVIGIDCGVYYEGFHTDMSETVQVQSPDSQRDEQNSNRKTQKDKVDTFLDTGKKALEEAIKQAKMGNRVGNISQTIQTIVEGGGYSVVRSLVGHGVGKKLHEEPQIPGYLEDPIEKTPLLKEGMTIAIEVIYNMGMPDVVYANADGWTISTKDGTLSGVFERTIRVTKDGPIVLTQ